MNFPKNFLDLIDEKTRAFLFLATINKDGAPQVTPVWFNTDGNYILINTNEGRLKDTNMKNRPNVSMVIQDPGNPYRYLGIKGKVVSHTTNSADEHINQLSLNYNGKPWPYREDQKRIIFRIEPIHFDEH